MEHCPGANPNDALTILEAKTIMRRNDHALSVTRPLYQLGDLVTIVSENEDGLTTDIGYVTGIEVDPPHTAPGWWYAVCLVGAEWANGSEWLAQDDIAGRVIHGECGYGS